MMADPPTTGPAERDAPVALVVEDDERIAGFVNRGLRAGGFAVEWVTTGAEAMARVEAGGVAVLILDLGLPDIDGLTVMSELVDKGVAVPVVVVTARRDARSRDEALRLGAAAYLTKPFAVKALLAAARASCGLPAD